MLLRDIIIVLLILFALGGEPRCRGCWHCHVDSSGLTGGYFVMRQWRHPAVGG